MLEQVSKYRTVKETAAAWNVSGRYVNLCITDGRIPGAVRMGNMWLIPADAKKTDSACGTGGTAPRSLSADLKEILAATYISAPRGNPDAMIEMVGDTKLRVIPEIGLAYARGDFDRVKHCYLHIDGDTALKLCASPIAVSAAISLGDYPFFTQVESWLKTFTQPGEAEDVSAFAELALTGAYLGAGALKMVPDWLKNGDFHALPPQTRQDAVCKRARYTLWLGHAESALAMAQTALAFGGSAEDLSYPDTYLRLVCAATSFALHREEDAKRWLLDAIRRNLPHGFITPFAEQAPLFGGLGERLLKTEDPCGYNAVVQQWKRTFHNWLYFHNQFTKDNITLMLTMREYEMALLATRHVPYAEIAKQFHLSVGRVKNIMNEIYCELSVANREELAKLIL